MTTSQEWHLVRRPHGAPVDEDFALVEVELPEPGAGQVLVRNTFMSVDPYMRGRMNDTKSYVPPFQLGRSRMDGGAVGEVTAVARRGRRPGGRSPWATPCSTGSAGASTPSCRASRGPRRSTPALAPAQAYLGVLGMPGPDGVRRPAADR